MSGCCCSLLIKICLLSSWCQFQWVQAPLWNHHWRHFQHCTYKLCGDYCALFKQFSQQVLSIDIITTVTLLFFLSLKPTGSKNIVLKHSVSLHIFVWYTHFYIPDCDTLYGTLYVSVSCNVGISWCTKKPKQQNRSHFQVLLLVLQKCSFGGIRN